MPHHPRHDAPGAWHHVMNRGLARRAVFETRDDIRYFLSRLARQVRAGALQVHAYAILTNHYHLLVRSTGGDLSRAIRSVQSAYVRRFNRKRRRDGPLFRGRFRSRRVASHAYWRVLIAYIDGNVVESGLAARPADYPHGSAWHYARATGPRWLERGAVEGEVRRVLGASRFEPADYERAFTRQQAGETRALVLRRMLAAPQVADPLDDLLSATPSAARKWLRSRAGQADGRLSCLALTTPDAVERAVRGIRRGHRAWPIGSRQRPQDGWRILETGLLRFACGLSLEEIGRRTGCPTSSAHRHVRVYSATIAMDDHFAGRAALALAAALQQSSRLLVSATRDPGTDALVLQDASATGRGRAAATRARSIW